MGWSAIVIVLVFAIVSVESFPDDAMIGIRSAAGDPLERYEREIEPMPMIGIRSAGDDDFPGDGMVGIAMPRASKPHFRPRPAGVRSGFCEDNLQYYNKNCLGMYVDRDENTRAALYQFCPWFENKCIRGR
ncbi:unnamed protein product [Nippostrongylus brasiliensis]|uniref:Uncharacterized protein n=1 Tax=Nippostrongylus brasiliensis TaxID=27835 RepID=A0A0N4YDV8_NIPBR|nr:unnamed protein product [Nippostrongylus brasiliensis]